MASYILAPVYNSKRLKAKSNKTNRSHGKIYNTRYFNQMGIKNLLQFKI